MAELAGAAQFGAELKDGFKPVNAWVSNGIAWLEEIQQFYRERSAIEKEYSAKLNALAKRYYEKKSKKISSLSVGDTPTMTPGSLESASLTTWTTQLSTVEARAAEHDRFASDLVSQVAEPIKLLAYRHDEIRKRHAEHAAKLEKERDVSYADLRKSKGAYDAACQEVENRRKKTESSFDHSKTKAQNSYQQQLLNMNNVKNTYLIAINVTNKQKEMYYHEYIPNLLDSLQDLSETRVTTMNGLWALAAELEAATLTRSRQHMDHLCEEIPRNDPALDSLMFARHNIASWQEPGNMGFEPSPVWHDDDAMVVDDHAKTFLRNLLSKSKGQLSELRREGDRIGREVEALKRIRQNIREGKDKRDEIEMVRNLFAMQEQLNQIDHKRITAEVEVATITAVVGDLTLGASSHNFKSQTFKIPTNCDLCGERIWGLSAKGFDCRDCGYTCHSKCEMKVPADCPGEQSKEERKKLKNERQEAARASHVEIPASADGGEGPKLSRTNTMNSLSSGYASSPHRSMSGAWTPTEESVPERSGTIKPTITQSNTVRKHRVLAPPPTQYVGSTGDEAGTDALQPGEQRGKMLYTYQANGEGEITVEEDEAITAVEPDDGSGWMRVRHSAQVGLVPASYVELQSATTLSVDRPASNFSDSSTSLAGSFVAPGKKKGPAVAPKRGAKKLKYVEAIYDYEARSDAEWNMSEGDRFVCITRDAGDGWAEVERGGQVRSVPANYIQDVP
ncbi:putative actin polymerization protein Bzz1 [Xylona heveae TC161]|uniref:Protein BZZ1 n=1 Tax=Xylona heveae (strain CBS 132557 / TC161) TaxID=1328760 RepID=A0A161TCR7_XYLHT|nr:putative actin polymerization protein Bzz1 [Xylona heveae TC161]KZF23597.1 putative actin polymerization protein Bzz1 [Xylona heveae TC161]